MNRKHHRWVSRREKRQRARSTAYSRRHGKTGWLRSYLQSRPPGQRIFALGYGTLTTPFDLFQITAHVNEYRQP
jgi:hypothetical protein